MAKLWIDTVVSVNVGSASSSTIAIDETGLSIQARRVLRSTLLRTIVRLDLAATVRDSGEGDQLVSLGIGVIGQDAFAAAGAAIPSPAVGLDFPIKGWVYRSRYRIYGNAVDDQNVDVVRIERDIRAKRLMANGRLVLIVINDANQGVATPVTYTGVIRTLYLVP